MATKLFLRTTKNNGIGPTYFDMVTTAGAASTTAVTATTAAGTEIQWTQTADGAELLFVSGRTPAAGFTLTATDISIWAHESGTGINAGGAYRIFKRAIDGTETELGGGLYSDGVEFTKTTPTEMAWTGNPTDTAFVEDDRILLKIKAVAAGGTMGAGTATLTYDAADAATGDSFFNIAETVVFKAEEPFNQTEWPVPSGRRIPSDVLGVTWGLPASTITPAITYVPRSATYFRTWAKDPAGVATRAQFENGAYRFLLNTTGVNLRAPTYWRNWPKDPAGVAINAQLGQGIRALILPVGQSPFVQTDWPNPTWPAYAISLRTWLHSPFARSDQFFGLAGNPNWDWPNPRAPLRGPQDWTQSAFRFVTGVPPRSNYDWPNPRGAVGGVSLRDWLWPINLNLLGQDRFFGLAGHPTFDWPNPRGAQRPVADWVRSAAPIYTTGGTKPFSQSEWNNPRGYVPTPQGWLQGFRDQLAAAAAKPFANLDWPNPVQVTARLGPTWLQPWAPLYPPSPPPPPPPPPPPLPDQQRGGGFGGGWNYSDGWGYNANKRIRKPGEPEDAPEPDDIRELLLDAFGRPKVLPVPPPITPVPMLLGPDVLAMLDGSLAQAIRDHLMAEQDQDEQDVEMLLLSEWL